MPSITSHLPSQVLNLPVLPIREGVLFPQTESVLTFGRSLSLAALNNLKNNSKIQKSLTFSSIHPPSYP